MSVKLDRPPAAEPTLPHASTHPANTLDNRGIAGAALLVMGFFVLSRLTGLAREIIIGAQFGTSTQLDAYLAAFRVPDILFQLVAGGALASAFIPTFSGYLARGDRAGAWLLFSRVLNGVTLALLLLATLAALFTEPLVAAVIAPGFSTAQQLLTADLMRWMLVSTVIFGAGGLVMGALNAQQHFLLPAAAPVLYNLAIILGAWLLTPLLGIYGLVVGVIAGSLAHLVVQIPGLIRRHVRYTPSLSLRDPGVREVGRLMAPRVLGLFFVQMHFLINTVLASGLAPGSISALNYAWLIMLLPQGVFAQAVATASFPTLSAQIANAQHAAMRATFSGILRTVLFLTIPAAVGLIVLGTPLTRVLLQRGEFSAESTRLVTFALRFYALGLVAHAAVEMTVRAFYALHDTATPVLVGVVAMVLNIVLSIWWVRYLSYGGLALANSVATTLEMVVLLMLLARTMQGIEGRRVLSTVWRSGAAALLMGAALWGWQRWIAQSAWGSVGDGAVWLTAIGGIVLAAVVYAVVSLALRSEEVWVMAGLVRRSG